MNAMPPDPGVPGRGVARALAGAARGDAAVADRVAPPAARRAVLASRVARARLRRRSRRRSSTSAAGWTRTSTRRSGCRLPAAAPTPDDRRQLGPRPARSSATPGTEPRRAPRDGPLLRPLAEGHRRTAPTTEPAIIWFEREYAEPEPFPATLPGRWRAATAYPHPAVETTRLAVRRWIAATRRRALAAGAATTAARRRASDRYRHRPTVGTRAALSWGAGGPPNGLARDLRPDEALGPTYTSEPLETRARDPRRPGGRPPPVGLGAGRDRGRPADRRRPGRHVGPGQRRDPQPDPSPVARSTRRRSSPGASRRSASSCARPATGSCPAIGSGSRWRRRPGRSSGRRRTRRRSSSTTAAATPSRLVLPVIPPAGGPGDAAGPGLQDDAAGRARRSVAGAARTSRSGGSRTTSSPGR